MEKVVVCLCSTSDPALYNAWDLYLHFAIRVYGVVLIKHRDKLMFYVQLYSINYGECKVWGFYGRQVAYDAVYNCCPSPKH